MDAVMSGRCIMGPIRKDWPFGLTKENDMNDDEVYDFESVDPMNFADLPEAVKHPGIGEVVD